jgi:diguanylate cyclase (GGDEF)-like protein
MVSSPAAMIRAGVRPPAWFGADGAPRAVVLPAWWITVASTVGLIAFTFSTMYADRGEDGFSTLWDTWMYYGVNTAVVALLLARGLFGREARGFWLLIALGNTTWLAASFVYTYYDANLDPFPVPATSDFLYYAGYPMLYAGLMLAGRRRGAVLRSAWLDGLIAGLGTAALTGAVLLRPIVSQSGASQATVVWNVAYPLADLMLMVFLIAAVTARALPSGAGSWVMIMGMALYAASDAIYAYLVTTSDYTAGTPLDSGWLVGTAMMAVGGWLPTRRPTERVGAGRTTRAVMPTSFALVALAVVLIGAFVDVPGLAVVLAVSTLLTATARAALTVREVARLHDSHAQARTDELTDLPNRRALRERLDQAFDAGRPFTLLLLDLDGFKEVNDSLGHEAGDALLVHVARQLRSALPERTFVARLGGDEFGIVVDGDPEHTRRLARQVGERVGERVELAGLTLRARASCGVATAPGDADNRSDLLRAADIAMYHAKRRGLGVATHQEAADAQATVQGLSDDPAQDRPRPDELALALDRGELVLHYQPIVDPNCTSVPGAEALVRWNHPTRGLLYPDVILDLAVRGNLMSRLTLTVLDQALRQLAEWRRGGRPHLTMNVNISASDLIDEELAGLVAHLLRDHGVLGEALTLEITEVDRVTAMDRAQDTIERLHRLGVRVSIDDFGVGYSSMAQLLALSADEVKIDRSFITGVHGNPRAQAMISATAQLGRTLGASVVAEGVEDAAELATVMALGCRRIQGYHVARPMPAEDFEDFLTGWAGDAAGAVLGPTTYRA